MRLPEVLMVELAAGGLGFDLLQGLEELSPAADFLAGRALSGLVYQRRITDSRTTIWTGKFGSWKSSPAICCRIPRAAAAPISRDG